MKPKNEKQPKTWRKVKLGEVLELKYGFGLPETKRKTGRVPVFGSSGIVGAHNEAAVQSQGIVIGRKGHVGSIHYSNVPFYPIDTVYYVDQLKIPGDIKFFYYFLKRMPFQQIGSDVGVPGLNRDIAYSLEVKIPEDPNIQKRIADVLSAFDDKIELNNKINQTLEQMAQAIFKEWFVKFKFPGHEKAKFIDSELGKIPKGWEVKQFGDGIITEVISNGIDKFNGEKIYLATADVDGKEISNTKTKITYDKRPSRADMQPIINSMWFAKMINTYKILFFFDGNKEDLEKFILSTGFMGIKCNNGSEFFMYLFISSKKFHSIKDTLVQGAVQEALTLGNIKRVKILIPSKEVLLRFNEIIKPMFGKIYKNRLENQKLASLRDLLLPKLMSGKILVKS